MMPPNMNSGGIPNYMNPMGMGMSSMPFQMLSGAPQGNSTGMFPLMQNNQKYQFSYFRKDNNPSGSGQKGPQMSSFPGMQGMQGIQGMQGMPFFGGLPGMNNGMMPNFSQIMGGQGQQGQKKDGKDGKE